MPRIALEDLPEITGTRYPAPHDAPCRDRRWLALAQAGGLTQFGVNRLILPPGVWSSQRHWHSHEDEFVMVLSGEVTLVTDAGPETLHAGDCAAFPAGVRDGHHFINASPAEAVLLVIGSRDERDHGEYSDIDMAFGPDRYRMGARYRRKDGTAL